MVKSKSAQISAQSVIATDVQRTMEIVDATFDCASVALNTTLAIATIEVPPVAAGFAYSAVTSTIACTTKLTLISSAASPEQYRQSACALEMLSPAGVGAAIAGVALGGNHCSMSAWSNTANDLGGAIYEASKPEYVLGSLTRGRWPLAILIGVTVLKVGWNSVTSDDRPSNPASNASPDSSSDGTRAGNPGSSERFVPRGGPGQHAEP